MSNELRTPLSTMLLQAQQLLRGELVKPVGLEQMVSTILDVCGRRS